MRTTMRSLYDEDMTRDEFVAGVKLLEGHLETMKANIKSRTDVTLEEWAMFAALVAIVSMLNAKFRTRDPYDTGWTIGERTVMSPHESTQLPPCPPVDVWEPAAETRG